MAARLVHAQEDAGSSPASATALGLILGALFAAMCALVASCSGLFNYPPNLCTVCDPAAVPGSPGACRPGQSWLCPPDAGAPDSLDRLPPLPAKPPRPNQWAVR
jgi:hypothetical protein